MRLKLQNLFKEEGKVSARLDSKNKELINLMNEVETQLKSLKVK